MAAARPPAEPAVAGGGLRLTDLRHILDNVVEASVAGLHELTTTLPGQPDAERKRALLVHLANTRQRLLRLLVVTQWANKAPAVRECIRALDIAHRHGDAFREAADQLAYLHADLSGVAAAPYDVNTACEVLETGSYSLLPEVIGELAPPPPPPPERQRAALRLMDQLLRAQLLRERLPAGLAVVGIAAGKATLRCGREYDAVLTLVPAPEPADVLRRCAPAASAQLTTSAGAAVKVKGEGGTNGGKPPQPVIKQEPGAATDASTVPSVLEEGGPTAMEVDARGGPAGPSRQADAVLAQQWRWRLLGISVLPELQGGSALATEQSTALQGAIEARMWAAADMAVLQQHSPAATSAPEQPPQLPVHNMPNGLLSASTSAVKSEQQARTEPAKEPLEVLHGIVRGVAGRVLLNAVVGSVRGLTRDGGRWARLLRMEPSRTLPMGIRLTFWPGQPCITSADLQAMTVSEPAAAATIPNSHLLPPINAKAAAASATTMPTASAEIEIGIQGEGGVQCIPCVELTDPLTSQPAELQLDPSTADAEAVLLQAVGTSAAVQLAGLEAELRATGRLAAAGGEAELVASSSRRQEPASTSVLSALLAASQTGRQEAHSAVLELRLGATVLLCVTVQLRSGRFQLQPGPVFAGDPTSNVPLLVGQEEVALLAARRDIAKAELSALSGHPSHGRASLAAVATELAALFGSLTERHAAQRLAVAGRALGLHPASLPPRLAQSFAASHPLAPQLPAKPIVLALPPAPPLRGFPAPHSPTASTSGTPYSSWGARFHLATDLQAASSAGPTPWLLLMTRCSGAGLPLEVLRIIRVPPQRQKGAPQQRAAGGKRKRSDAEDDEGAAAWEQPSASEPQPNGVHLQSGTKPGTNLGAEVARVLHWACLRSLWESLLFQLQVLEVPFVEQISIAGHSIPQQYPAHQPCFSALPSPVAGRSIRLECFQEALQSLPAGPGISPVAAAKSGGAVEAAAGTNGIHAEPTPEEVQNVHSSLEIQLSKEGAEEGRWQLHMGSTYLAGLSFNPAASTSTSSRLDGQQESNLVTQIPAGLLLQYSAACGDTVLTALTDALRVLRLHTCLARLAAASSSPAAHPVAANMPLKRHHAAAASEALVANGSATAEAHPAVAPLVGATFRLQACGVVRLAAVRPLEATLAISASAGPESAAGTSNAAVIGVEGLELIIGWERGMGEDGSVAASGAGETGGAATASGEPAVRCRIRSTLALPNGMAEALEQLADAGEEGLFLEALAITGPALWRLSTALSPHALRQAGLLPSEAALTATHPPYRCTLTLHRAPALPAVFELRMFAAGLTWIALQSASPLPSQPSVPSIVGEPQPDALDSIVSGSGAQDGMAAALLKLPGQLKGVYSAEQSNDAASVVGVWVEGDALSDAIAAVLQHVGQSRPQRQ